MPPPPPLRNFFWDRHWGRALQPLVYLFSLSLVPAPEVSAKVHLAQYSRDSKVANTDANHVRRLKL